MNSGRRSGRVRLHQNTRSGGAVYGTCIQPREASAQHGGVDMPRKRRSRKKRGSRPTKSKLGVEQRTKDRSFGSGLDEIGFRPLGRRIFVSKQRSGGERATTASEPETELSSANESPVPPADDPLGYDTRDPSWVRKAAAHALSGADKGAIEKEVDRALRRWGLRGRTV